MSYLRYLCLLSYSGVQRILCILFCFSSSCVPYVVSFSGLSIFEDAFGILLRLFSIYTVLHFFTLCNRGWGRDIGGYFDLLTHSCIFLMQ